MKNQPTEVSINEVSRAQQSINGRLRRLKTVKKFWRTEKSPIAAIGCFDNEVEEMENTLKKMSDRLNRAKVIIPAE
jgi:hypothetical protein